MLKRTLVVALLALSGRTFGKGMVVGPARLEMRLAPGESRTVTLTVGNTEPALQQFRARVVPFDLSETGEVIFENIPEPQPPPTSWIELSPEEVEVGPDLSATVSVRVTAPSSARGTIVGAILVSLPAKGRAVSGMGVTTEPRVLVPVYVTVAGTETPGAEVASFDVSRDPGGVFHFRAAFRNTGNTLLRPAGTWVLEQQTPAGPVEILVVPFSGDPVLPGKTRKFEGEGRGKVPPGEVTGSVFFEFGPGKHDFASKSAPVHAVESGPARETEHAAAGTIVTTSRSPGGSAAVPVRISMVKDGIRLDAGGPVKYSSQTPSNPPALILDLVGYRVVNPGPLEGSRFVRRLEVQEIQKRPLVTRVTIFFRLPVDVQIQELEKGLFIPLKPSLPTTVSNSGAAPAGAASPPPVPISAAAVAVAASPTPVPTSAAAVAVVASPTPVPTSAAAVAVAASPTSVPTSTAAVAVAASPTPAQKSAAPPPTLASSAGPPPAAPAPLQRGYVVQVGTFAVAANAETAKKVVQAMGYSVSEQMIQRDGRDLWVVMAGPFADRAAAVAASRKLGGVVRMAAPKR